MVDTKASKSEAPGARGVLDATCLAGLRSLDPDGGGQLVRRVLATYLSSLVRLLDEFRAARAEMSWEGISRVAHTLKSSSASLGALVLAGLCADIERLVRSGDVESAQALLDRFDAEARRVEQAVRDELAACEAAGA